MPRHTDSLFGLPPVATKHPTGARTQLTLYHPGQQLSRREQKVIDEMRLQQFVIEAESTVAEFAISQFAELHVHGAVTFNDVLAEVIEIKQQQRTEDAQRYVNEFTTRQLSIFGREMLGALEVATTSIAYEVHRPLYPEPEPPEAKKGFFQRLFGG
ncbi:MAG: hypothetical protein IT328_23775 [Caldilineaceae bacterium]|nr:hypothetical protein [Caldilineaceae bacterium]